MVILLALEMTIPVCVNKMINGLAVENGIVTFWEESFYLHVHMESFVFYQHLIQNYIFVLAINYYGTCGNKFIKCYGTAATWKMCRKKKDKFKFVLSNQAYTAFAIAVIYSIGGFTNLLSMIAFLVIVFLYSVPVGMTLIICIFVTLVVSFFTGKKILEGYETCNVMQEKDTSQIYETVDMVEVTRSNGLEDYYLKKIK